MNVRGTVGDGFILFFESDALAVSFRSILTSISLKINVIISLIINMRQKLEKIYYKIITNSLVSIFFPSQIVCKKLN